MGPDIWTCMCYRPEYQSPACASVLCVSGDGGQERSMETDTSRSKASESGDGQASRGGQGEGAVGTRRKLSEDQEREVTRLYSETDTPVSEISKRFGIGESSVYRVAQRHGASLRGRTATASAGGGDSAGASAAGAATGRRGRGRAAASGGTRAAAAPTAATAPTR